GLSGREGDDAVSIDREPSFQHIAGDTIEQIEGRVRIRGVVSRRLRLPSVEVIYGCPEIRVEDGRLEVERAGGKSLRRCGGADRAYGYAREGRYFAADHGRP